MVRLALHPASLAVATLACGLLASCGSEPEWSFSGCDPLDESMCSLPWPSSVMLRPDETTETGWRVALQTQDLPRDKDGGFIDPTIWNERDGFSVATPFMTSLGQWDVSVAPGKGDIERYADADIGSILLDVDTGERIPHWVEVDAHAESPEERLTMLWPAQQLEFGHHYIVAFRNVQTADGSAVEPSAAFLALREGTKTDDPDIENRRKHYKKVIFPALEEAGFPQEELTLAWDVHTASAASTRGRMLSIRDDAFERVGDAPTYRWVDVESFDCEAEGQVIARTLRGRLEAPLYTDDPGVDTFLNRDEAGQPFADGTREAPFLVQVPCSVVQEPGPTHVVQYGHGLLGDEREAEAGWLKRFANDQRFIIVAGRQTGMSSEDFAAIGIMLARDVSGFPAIPERLHQGILENLLLTKVILNGLPEDPELAVEGTPLLDGDTDKVAWYGISQGGIIGGAIVGASPDLTRGVFSVGGGPYPLLLPRSVDFTRFFDILKGRYPNTRDQMFIIQGLLVHLWDVGESAAWVDLLRDNQVLSQIAIGDAQVHLEGSRWQARSAGLSLVEDPVEPVFGLETRSAPFMGSGYVEVSYGFPTTPDTNLPPDKATDTHECPRRSPALQEQVAHFVRTGEIKHTCEGACVFTWDDGCPALP